MFVSEGSERVKTATLSFKLNQALLDSHGTRNRGQTVLLRNCLSLIICNTRLRS